MRRVQGGETEGMGGGDGDGPDKASFSAPPPPPAPLQAEPSGVMGEPVLVLWALLASLGCAGGATEPGKGSPLGCGGCGGLRGLRGAAGASLGSGRPLRPGQVRSALQRRLVLPRR